jgi:hypothetical protein
VGRARKAIEWLFSPYTASHRRRQLAVAALGAVLACAGLLPLGLLLPELPFAGAPTTSIGDAHPGDLVKVYGRINCSCLVAITWSEERVGLGLGAPNASIEPFTLHDPSGSFWVDTDSLATLKRGTHNGDYFDNDFAAVYGHVYDQGNGVLALRAQFIAASPDDTLARHWGWMVLAAAAGGTLLAAALADRLVFGAAPA